jgi:hypothetical protein
MSVLVWARSLAVARSGELKKENLTKDLDVLGRLTRQEQWRPPENSVPGIATADQGAAIFSANQRADPCSHLKCRQTDSPVSNA